MATSTSPAPQSDNKSPKNDVSQFLTYRLSRLQSTLNAQAALILRQEAGLGLVQWRIIALIKLHAPAKASVLSKKVGMDAGQISRNLKILINDGYISSTTDPDDQRQQLLSLTRKGLQTHKSVFPKMRKRQAKLTKGLNIKQQKQLLEMIDLVTANASDTTSV